MSTLWAIETAAGELVQLDGSDGIDELGVTGHLLPPYELLSQETYGGNAKLDRRGAGERTRVVRSRPRQMLVRVLVQDGARSEAALEAQLEEFVEQLNPEEGPLRLLATKVDDQGEPLLDRRGNVRTRALTAYYVGGAEGQARGEENGGWWAELPLVFRADDPYWRALVPASRVFQTETPVLWLPILPERLGSASLLGESTEHNDGSVRTYPVLRLIVPGTRLTFTNRTSGASWSLNTTGADGQPVTVDTRPTLLGGGRTVTREDGLSLYDQLTGDPWPLLRGRNDLTITVAGETPGSTRLELTYDLRHNTA